MSDACLRCSHPLPGNAKYCPACGVSLALAATGEHAIVDFERFFNYGVDLMCLAGTDARFIAVNPAFERALGYSTKELLSVSFLTFIHPDDRDATVAEVGSLADGTPTLAFTNRYIHKDGHPVRLHWRAYPEPGTGLIYAVARVAADDEQHLG
ncbi:MAG: PAS domain-containing protein [Gemmatimonadetes bacterium]|nr:PAS domain-containing protein [Gemmatimonadota bacterium]